MNDFDVHTMRMSYSAAVFIIEAFQRLALREVCAAQVRFGAVRLVIGIELRGQPYSA